MSQDNGAHAHRSIRLNPKEYQILEMRGLLGPLGRSTLEQIGGALGLTRERVRQLEVSGLAKLREQASASPPRREDGPARKRNKGICATIQSRLERQPTNSNRVIMKLKDCRWLLDRIESLESQTEGPEWKTQDWRLP